MWRFFGPNLFYFWSIGKAVLYDFLGPIVQCIVCLTRALVVKMLPVQVRTISHSQVFC